MSIKYEIIMHFVSERLLLHPMYVTYDMVKHNERGQAIALICSVIVSTNVLAARH